MDKVLISSSLYKKLNILFHILLMVGLIWQITQISINFFKFDTVSDIRLTLPEKADNPAAINLCFRSDMLHKKSEYQEIVSRYPTAVKNDIMNNITLTDFMDMFLDGDKLILNTSKDGIIEFFINSFSCYQISGVVVDTSTVMDAEVLRQADGIMFAVSEPFPDVRYSRFNSVVRNLLVPNVTNIFHFTYQYYNIIKLEHPYVDDCLNYRTLGFISRENAVDTCYRSHIEGVKKSSRKLIYLRMENGEYRHLSSFQDNITIWDICENNYPKDNCFEKSVFTSLSIFSYLVRPGPTRAHLGVEKGMEPSFAIESKPRIDNIDYVTYVFGAISTWFGFSFVLINPLPLFFVINNSAIRNEGYSSRREENKYKNKVYLMERVIGILCKETRKLRIRMDELSRD